MSARETARLMGLPDEYALPENYNEAYHLTGDGVVVPVVRHIAAHLLEPLIARRVDARRGVTREDPAQRSAIMRAVKGRDTSPELAVRALLRALRAGLPAASQGYSRQSRHRLYRPQAGDFRSWLLLARA